MEELIKKARKHDADAFTKLMMEQMQTMYKTASAILDNEEDAADAISDTILACWEKLGQLRENKYFRTWMIRILVNKCRDIIRKKRNLFFTDEMPDIPFRDCGYENLEWKQTLKDLDERYRIILLLYYVEGFKVSEISDIMELPESTVRTRISRGKEKMIREYKYVERKGEE